MNVNIADLEKICTFPVLEDEPMSRHTSFQVGGIADFFVIPRDIDELSRLIKFLGSNEMDYLVIGNGTNLLVSDEGYRGVIICLRKSDKTNFGSIDFRDCGAEGIDLESGAGTSLTDMGKYAAQIGVTGFEPLSGIPGSMGGACIMNAGAYGTEMKDLVTGVGIIDSYGNIRDLGQDDINFGYRTSSLMDEGFVVTNVRMRLKKGDSKKIRALNNEYLLKRKEKQPLEYPSAGSMFKRPEGYFAGKLISDAGLRGYTIGGAKVSEKHAGFLINLGDASAADVYRLMRHCQKTVYEKYRIKLAPEVRLVGEFE